MLNINKFAKVVHENAVKHGWWETERPTWEIFAMIHSEWSEALNEYREGRPMVWYSCKNSGVCDETCGLTGQLAAQCKARGEKPEGIAVELIDGCIRILDFLAEERYEIDPYPMDELVKDYAEKGWDVPRLVTRLHGLTSLSYNKFSEKLTHCAYVVLYNAFWTVYAWIDAQGYSAEEIMLAKHAYNLTRPYRHGMKKC